MDFDIKILYSAADSNIDRKNRSLGGSVPFKIFGSLLLVAMVPTLSLAGNLDDLFEEHYFKQYVSGQCGKNVLNFVKAVKRTQGDVDFLRVVTVENKGFSVFGMVNAEKARGQRFNRPAEEEANWYHHVIALDSSGMVYDFDFGTTPRIVSMEEYLEEMFLDETECEKPAAGEFCAGRGTKLNDYKFSSVTASEALQGKANRVKEAPMNKVLHDWEVLTK